MERVLSVLDGAVLVVSAVEGVQAQTRVLMRALRRLRIPTLIFVNKIDRARRASDDELLREHRRAADARASSPMGSVDAASARARRRRAVPAADRGCEPSWSSVLADHDDALLAAYVDDERRCRTDGSARELARADRAARWCTRCSSARRSPAPASTR